MVKEKGPQDAVDEKTEKMGPYRRTGIIVGALFILATAITIVGVVAMGFSLDDDDYLDQVADHETGIIIAVICWIVLAVSVAGIGFFMHPILKRCDEGLSLGYLSFRLIESVLILVSAVCLLSLLTLNQGYVAGDLDVTYYESSGELLKALFDWSFIVGTMFFLGLGGLVIYYLCWRFKLVPSWLSLWGLVGGACILLYGLISLFGEDPAVLAIPIAVQEMVFAVWLIAKGFNPPARAS